MNSPGCYISAGDNNTEKNGCGFHNWSNLEAGELFSSKLDLNSSEWLFFFFLISGKQKLSNDIAFMNKHV